MEVAFSGHRVLIGILSIDIGSLVLKEIGAAAQDAALLKKCIVCPFFGIPLCPTPQMSIAESYAWPSHYTNILSNCRVR